MKPGDFDMAKRLAPQHPERWEPVGQFIWDGTREVGTMKSPALAKYVCAIHNVFLALVNKLLMLTRRLKDVESLEVLDDE